LNPRLRSVPAPTSTPPHVEEPSPTPDGLPVSSVLRLLTAAQAGIAEAGLFLGLLHEGGLGFPVSGERALEWFLCAAATSPRRPEKARLLQVRDRFGERLFLEGLAEDLARAAEFLERQDPYAAEFQGEGVRRGFRWYARRDLPATARAEFAVARCTLLGLGVEASPHRATPWLERAAEGGIAEAALRMGFLRAHGCPAHRDPEAAQRWFEGAREQLEVDRRAGSPEASYRLGVVFMEGLGTPQDLDRARVLLAGPARAGHRDSRARLRLLAGERCYRGGHGCPRHRHTGRPHRRP